MESKTEQQLKLSKLEEGEYMFKVAVTGTDPDSLESKGEAVGIVTVFPGKKSFQVNRRRNLLTFLEQDIILDENDHNLFQSPRQNGRKW